MPQLAPLPWAPAILSMWLALIIIISNLYIIIFIPDCNIPPNEDNTPWITW